MKFLNGGIAEVGLKYEKGLVENTIGLCREFFPKLTTLPENQNVYREAQDKINSRPKKVLGFATPKSLYKKLLTNSPIWFGAL